MTRQASAPGTQDRATKPAPPAPSPWRHLLWVIALALFVILFFVLPAVNTSPSVSLTYSRFLHDVDAKKVKTVTLAENGSASGNLTNGKAYSTAIPSQAGSAFLHDVESHGVDITATTSGTPFWEELVSWIILLLPFLILGYFWWRLSRSPTGMRGILGVGRSKAQVFDTERPSTTFADVAGYDGPKREIREVVDFLRDSERYARAGAVPPRGILMIGPPGTGKTLLARAVAGEANVPFLFVTGSSFVEMFVGVGAARVRDLFTQARTRAPAIIFVDEIDAIGQRRGGSAVVANDEREQTLNQLLAEMDGFDPATGVVVLAATNRPEILDPALLRPGRFDRQVVIPLPTLPERVAILQVHCRGKQLAHSVDLSVVARGTPGFSGADLANLVNEAAIVAVRAGRDLLVPADFDEARDRIILGEREGSNVLYPEEKHGVAVHESGHALVAAYSKEADPVDKVTILPAGQTLGVTEQLPLIERHMYGEGYLHDTLAVLLGGRASEELVLGEGSTGAANDLSRATNLATQMVREFGLSDELGPVSYPEGGSEFLDGGGSVFSSRPYAEQTQAKIDGEVSRLLLEAERRATNILSEHLDVLDRLVEMLVAKETVDGTVVYQLAGRPYPSGAPPQTLAPDAHAPSAAPVDSEQPLIGTSGLQAHVDSAPAAEHK